MRIGRVIGNVVSTSKHERLNGVKLMIVEPIDFEGKKIARSIIVADFLNSADGSIIYWVEDGVTICKWMDRKSIPIRGCIVGQVDTVDLKGKNKILAG